MGKKTYRFYLGSAILKNDHKKVYEILAKEIRSEEKIKELCTSNIGGMASNFSTYPLLLAAELYDPSIIKYLVRNYHVDINYVFKESDGFRIKIKTALLLSVKKGVYDTVEAILEMKGDPNIQDHKGRSSLHHAVRKADSRMTKLLLQSGAQPSNCDKGDNTPLHVSSIFGHVELSKMLISYGSDLYQKGQMGALPIHVAAKEGHVGLLKLFCEHGVNPNIKMPCYDGREKAAIHVAAEEGHYECVKVLLETFSADVNIGDSEGETPLHCCVLHEYNPMGMRTKEAFTETLKMLITNGCMINSQNGRGETALHLAARNQFHRNVEILILAGSDPLIEDNSGDKALDLVDENDGATRHMLKQIMENRELDISTLFEFNAKGFSTSTINLKGSDILMNKKEVFKNKAVSSFTLFQSDNNSITDADNLYLKPLSISEQSLRGKNSTSSFNVDHEKSKMFDDKKHSNMTNIQIASENVYNGDNDLKRNMNLNRDFTRSQLSNTQDLQKGVCSKVGVAKINTNKNKSVVEDFGVLETAAGLLERMKENLPCDEPLYSDNTTTQYESLPDLDMSQQDKLTDSDSYFDDESFDTIPESEEITKTENLMLSNCTSPSSMDMLKGKYDYQLKTWLQEQTTIIRENPVDNVASVPQDSSCTVDSQCLGMIVKSENINKMSNIENPIKKESSFTKLSVNHLKEQKPTPPPRPLVLKIRPLLEPLNANQIPPSQKEKSNMNIKRNQSQMMGTEIQMNSVPFEKRKDLRSCLGNKAKKFSSHNIVVNQLFSDTPDTFTIENNTTEELNTGHYIVKHMKLNRTLYCLKPISNTISLPIPSNYELLHVYNKKSVMTDHTDRHGIKSENLLLEGYREGSILKNTSQRLSEQLDLKNEFGNLLTSTFGNETTKNLLVQHDNCLQDNSRNLDYFKVDSENSVMGNKILNPQSEGNDQEFYLNKISGNNHSVCTEVNQIIKESLQMEGSLGCHEFISNNTQSSTKTNRRCIVYICKNQLDFNIVGGNIGGVFIHHQKSKSNAEKAGLLRGDKILDINGISTSGKTKEQVMTLLNCFKDFLKLDVEQNHAMYNSVLHNSSLGDSFHVRALFDHVPEYSDELSISYGDIFWVQDTVSPNRQGYWRALKLQLQMKYGRHGLLPNFNKSKEIVLANKVSDLGKYHKQNVVKDVKRSKSLESITELNDQKTADSSRNVFYEVIDYKTVQFPRPVLLLGLFCDIVRDKLAAEYPELYVAPKMEIEVLTSNEEGVLEPVNVFILKSIAENKKHCLAIVSPNGIEFLNKTDLNPIVIYLSPGNKNILKFIRKQLAPMFHKKASYLFHESATFERQYGHLFTASISYTIDNSWYKLLQDTINRIQNQPQWITVGQTSNFECEFMKEPEHSVKKLRQKRFNHHTMSDTVEYSSSVEPSFIESMEDIPHIKSSKSELKCFITTKSTNMTPKKETTL